VEPKFNVEFLEEAIEFLDSLDNKAREKILYNIYKARVVTPVLCTTSTPLKMTIDYQRLKV
jgi:hypothetical protein